MCEVVGGAGGVPNAFLALVEIGALIFDAEAISWRASGRIEDLGSMFVVEVWIAALTDIGCAAKVRSKFRRLFLLAAGAICRAGAKIVGHKA